MYKFNKKECPFCSCGQGGDDRSRTGLEECDHTFSPQEYFGLLQGIEDLKTTISESKGLLRKMEKKMGLKEISRLNIERYKQ